MTDPREVVGEGKRDQTALDQTLQELIKMRKKNKNIFEFYIEDKGHHFGKEDGDQDAARDNTTPLMRKVPESEGDRMRSALQEVLVSRVGWEARELCNLQSFFTHESSNSCQMASYEAFRDSCRAPFSSLHRLELQQLKRASYWRQDGQTDQ